MNGEATTCLFWGMHAKPFGCTFRSVPSSNRGFSCAGNVVEEL